MKPILLGMCNPEGGPPLDPDGVTGRRLISIIGRDAFDAFDLENMIERRKWSRAEARERAELVRNSMSGRDVVVLGNECWLTLSLPKARTLGSVRFSNANWHRVPHPSGRSLYYNSDKNRVAARRLMREIAGV